MSEGGESIPVVIAPTTQQTDDDEIVEEHKPQDKEPPQVTAPEPEKPAVETTVETTIFEPYRPPPNTLLIDSIIYRLNCCRHINRIALQQLLHLPLLHNSIHNNFLLSAH